MLRRWESARPAGRDSGGQLTGQDLPVSGLGERSGQPEAGQHAGIEPDDLADLVPGQVNLPFLQPDDLAVSGPPQAICQPGRVYGGGWRWEAGEVGWPAS
jgi:hypothetical protein